MSECALQIAATFTAEPVKRFVEALLGSLGERVDIQFAPFNQIFQQLIDPNSAFGKNDKGVNIVLARLEDLGKPNEPESLRQNSQALVDALKTSADRFRAPLIVAFCPASSVALKDSRLCVLLDEIEGDLTNELRDVRGLQLITSKQLVQSWDLSEYDNPQGNRLGAICYTDRFYGVLGQRLARSVYPLLTNPQKVIVLDCDQTLWKGVCGEDGPHGIEFDEPRKFLQEFMLAQYRAGMLLCLCSKNNEADVWRVFKERREMPLQTEHLAASRINWGLKSENLKSLARELQLGLDSFIFVDDDRVVCAEVEANCPEVLCICLPEDVTTIATFLREHWAFDHLTITSEDSQRTRMYRENAQRSQLQGEATSLGEFLKKLDLQCEIVPMTPGHVERVAQLTQRTNQFNATTIRRTENEIQRMLNDGACKGLAVNVRDRFGDYGLVGTVFYLVKEDRFEVESFLLSCRALGRGIEHRILSELGKRAVESGREYVSVNFTRTEKNLPALEFFERTGGYCKQSLGDSLLFKYPAQVVEQLVYDPNDRPASTEHPNSDPGVIERPSTRSRPSAGLHRIATELHQVDVLMAQSQSASTTRPQLQTPYMAPSGSVETELAQLWQRLLQIESVGVEDNFFELGGDSLLGVSLLVEIEDAFGKELSLANLLTAPTIRQLAHFVSDSNRQERWRYLVPIQTAGTKPPLYCMHAAGGNVLFYRDLAQNLGSDHPVYGLQAREQIETGAYPNRVEAMAEHYIEEILDLDSRGPYYLCGSSFGGLVAYEVAQQLRRRGKEIALLALFDTYGPGYPQPLTASHSTKHKLLHVWNRLQTLKGQMGQLGTEEKLDFIKGKARKIVVKIERKWLWKKNDFQIRYGQATGRALPRDLQRNHKAIQQALDNYVPQPYEGRLTLFRASKQPQDIVPDLFLGWSGLSMDIDLYESPGVHGAMTVNPYARSLAEKLALCIQDSGPVQDSVTPLKTLTAVA